MKGVAVVTGAGGIGQAIARRVGAGKHVVLADLRVDAAQSVAKTLAATGFEANATHSTSGVRTPDWKLTKTFGA